MTTRTHDRLMEGKAEAGTPIEATVPAFYKFVVRCITLANDALLDAADVKLTLLPSGGGAVILWTGAVPAQGALILPLLATLYDGDTVGLTTVNADCWITINGVFYTPA